MSKLLASLAIGFSLAMSLAACDQTANQATAPQQQAGSEIPAAELNERITAQSAPLILDVRGRNEYDAGHIPGAQLISHDAFLSDLDATLAMLPDDRSTEIVLHCHSGKRASIVDEVMQQAGFSNVRHLQGDWQGWQADGYPIEN